MALGPLRQTIAFVVDHDHLDGVQRLADAATLGQPIRGVDGGDDRTFGAAVILRDLRTHPLDQSTFHGRRTGRRSVPHGDERITTEPSLHIRVQIEHALHLSGHQMNVGALMRVDEFQHRGRVELVLHHHRRTTDHRKVGERPLRRVVEGTAQHRAPRYGKEVGKPGRHQLHDVGGQRHATGQHSAHALGSTGGARGVEHRATQHLIGRFVGRCAGDHVFVRDESSVAHHGRARTTTNTDHGLHAGTALVAQGDRGRVSETLVDEHGLGVGIGEHVRQLVGHPVPVHRHVGPTTMSTGHRQLEEFAVISDDHRHGVAGRQPGVAQPVHETIHPVVQLGPCDAPIFVDECVDTASLGEMGRCQNRHARDPFSATGW